MLRKIYDSEGHILHITSIPARHGKAHFGGFSLFLFRMPAFTKRKGKNRTSVNRIIVSEKHYFVKNELIHQ